MVRTTNAVALKWVSTLRMIAPTTIESEASSMMYSKIRNNPMLNAASGPRMCLLARTARPLRRSRTRARN